MSDFSMDQMLNMIGGGATYKPGGKEVIKPIVQTESIEETPIQNKKVPRKKLQAKEEISFSTVKIKNTTKLILKTLASFEKGQNLQWKVNTILEEWIENNKDDIKKILKKNIKI